MFLEHPVVKVQILSESPVGRFRLIQKALYDGSDSFREPNRKAYIISEGSD